MTDDVFGLNTLNYNEVLDILITFTSKQSIWHSLANSYNIIIKSQDSDYLSYNEEEMYCIGLSPYFCNLRFLNMLVFYYLFDRTVTLYN